MKRVKRLAYVLGSLVWGAISIAAYLLSFGLKLVSAIFAMLTIMMAAGDRATRRGNRLAALRRSNRGIG